MGRRDWIRAGVLGASVLGASAWADAPVETPVETSPRGSLQQAIENAVARSAEPERTRSSILARLQASHACYRGDMTQEEFDALVAQTGLLPPTLGPSQPRYFYDSFVWLGEAGVGNANTSRRASLTYSFPPDGTQWGLSCGSVPTIAPNALNAAMIAAYPTSPPTVDKGREYIRSALAAWRRVGGLSYQEVADNGEAMNTSTTRTADRGDIRIGGIALGTAQGVLAYNSFPHGGGFTTCVGGDMCINTSYFTAAYFKLPTWQFRYFRNTVAHEHGHGLGLKHVVPCDLTKLMEPTIDVSINVVSPDDVRGIIANYGDRYAGNHSFATAKDFGSLTSPSLRAVLEKDLGLNGPTVQIPGQGSTPQDDYFKFSLASTQTVTIMVTPTGIAGEQGMQSTGCNGGTAAVDGSRAGHLQLQLLNNAQQVIASSTVAPVGSPQIITQSLGAGTYAVRVWDFGDAFPPNGTAASMKVQVYDLLIRPGSAKAPPQAIAGVNKRTPAGQLTFFMGDYNSRPTEADATIDASGYDWDLDGDGTFETLDIAQPSIIYQSNGVFNVTLRVTDSNGMSATDTITCTVTGATTSLSACTPASANQGATVPVTLTGTNLKLITQLNQISISGSGVSITGTPVPNGAGTQITGISLVVGAGAATGSRTFTLTGADGPGSMYTSGGLFTVTQVVVSGACCAANGQCTSLTPSQCQSGGGAYMGDNSPCVPNPCPQPGPCCFADGSCTLALPASCAGAGGSPMAGTTCSPNPCPQQGACCFANGSCTFVLPASCTASGGSPTGGAACNPNPCPQPTGACCFVDGSCSTLTGADCAAGSGSYQGNGAACNPNPCPQPTGGCCASSGVCSTLTLAQCLTSGGVYQGNGAACMPNPCPPPTGACCAGSTCAVTTQAACSGPNRRWVSAGAACNAQGNATSPCCKADFNQSSPTGVGGVTVQDMFDYLTAWFARDAIADVNASGAVTVQDLFDFLTLWFAGCKGP